MHRSVCFSITSMTSIYIFKISYNGSSRTLLLPVRHVCTWVAIGRTLQPFPRSKRSGHVSAHSAFQLDLSTLKGRIRPEQRRGAPASEGHHLPSSLHPLTSLLTGLPWRTFTVSQLLQPGVWLLRRLRPPRRTLACSRPTLVGTHREHGVPQFHHKRRPSDP